MSTQALRQAATGTVAPRGGNDISSLLEKMKPQMAAALPKHMSPDRVARIALTCFRTTPALQQCEPASFIASVMQAAQLGLEPGLAGSAYLVPFKKNWKDEKGQWQSRMECQMIPGYRGLIDLARRSGDVSSISVELVYEHDTFKLSLGLEQTVTHEPLLDGDRGKLKLVYAVAKFKDGAHQFIWMPLAEVERIRIRSKAKDNGPWVTDYEEMVKKTAIRRLCKLLPMSVELHNAVTLSDASDAGVKPVIEGDYMALPQAASEPAAGDADPIPGVDMATGEVLQPAAQEQRQPEPAQPQPTAQPTSRRAAAQPAMGSME